MICNIVVCIQCKIKISHEVAYIIHSFEYPFTNVHLNLDLSFLEDLLIHISWLLVMPSVHDPHSLSLWLKKKHVYNWKAAGTEHMAIITSWFFGEKNNS